MYENLVNNLLSLSGSLVSIMFHFHTSSAQGSQGRVGECTLRAGKDPHILSRDHFLAMAVPQYSPNLSQVASSWQFLETQEGSYQVGPY